MHVNTITLLRGYLSIIIEKYYLFKEDIFPKDSILTGNIKMIMQKQSYAIKIRENASTYCVA